MRLLGGVQIYIVGMFFEPVLDLLLQMELLGGAAYKRIDCINALYSVTSILVLSPIFKLDITFIILRLLYILCLVSARCLVNERRASMVRPMYL